MRIVSRQAHIPYQDYHMLCVSCRDRPIFRTRITTCYVYRVETGPYFVPGLPHVVAPSAQARHTVMVSTDQLGRTIAVLIAAQARSKKPHTRALLLRGAHSFNTPLDSL